MIHSEKTINNAIEIIIYSCLLYMLYHYIMKIKYNNDTQIIKQYETQKQEIYKKVQIKSSNLLLPFQETPLNKIEILEILMYKTQYQNIITGKPRNDTYQTITKL